MQPEEAVTLDPVVPLPDRSASWVHRIPRGLLGINALIMMTALYLALALNTSFWAQVWRGLPTPFGAQEAGIVAVLFIALNVLLSLVMLMFSHRRIVRPALAGLLVLASVCSYFMDSFGVVIDAPMIANLLHTDAREAGELLGWRLFLHVALFGLLPAALVLRVRLKTGPWYRELLRRLVLGGLALTVLIACVAANYKSVTLWVRAHRDIRLYVNPTYPIYSTIRQLKSTIKPQDTRVVPIATDAVRVPAATGKPRVVVLVVGETARAQNFSLLGYPRATNPQLAAIPGVVSFEQVWSCGTATAISVPCMFSRFGREAFSRSKARSEENLLDVLQRTGVSVLWRDNNSDCKGVCARVPTQDLRRQQVDAYCDADGCHDEILLEGLDELIATSTGDRLVVLHLLGSHGPSYYKRYPAEFRRFVPDCAQDDVQACSRDTIVNAYDNSILYTDHVLARLIELLKRHEAQVEPTMLYVSDHGESLGENGIYLHGLPYALAPDEQTRVPLLLWSPAHALDCMESQRARVASHDDLFHTMLGLFSVRTRLYQPRSDLIHGCGPSGG